jgi:hypothetical protein
MLRVALGRAHPYIESAGGGKISGLQFGSNPGAGEYTSANGRSRSLGAGVFNTNTILTENGVDLEGGSDTAAFTSGNFDGLLPPSKEEVHD